ncbi:MAG: hypothetical protein CME62_09785 [Halobacteriovoraceae bacterium]|nr:hypothetical protein [Halobacteriovoraceae bacterium]|tara:strand:- start:3214 stop:3606 length:393 start_codon:yes stop_codon:yes gene_type:complete
MINTRFIYQEITDISEAIRASFDVYEFLKELVYCRPVDELVTVYGDQTKLWAGHEITGREENIYHHEQFKVNDFSAEKFVVENIPFETYQDLAQKILGQLKDENWQWFRIKFSQTELGSAEVYFFNNREK